MRTVGSFVSAIALTISLGSVASAKADHHQIAKSLEKRDFSGHATYFVDGLGACGLTNGPNDFIVALNTPQYGSGSPGPECFKMITINAGGKSAVAEITDECPGCPYGSLDMSEGLFKHFNDLSVGEFDITWSYNDGSGGGGDDEKTTTKHTTKHTTTHHTTPTTTWVPPTSTSTKAHTSTSHTTHTTPTTTSTKETTSTTSTSSSAAATTTSVASGVQNLEAVTQFIVQLADLLDVATGSN